MTSAEAQNRRRLARVGLGGDVRGTRILSWLLLRRKRNLLAAVCVWVNVHTRTQRGKKRSVEEKKLVRQS